MILRAQELVAINKPADRDYQSVLEFMLKGPVLQPLIQESDERWEEYTVEAKIFLLNEQNNDWLDYNIYNILEFEGHRRTESYSGTGWTRKRWWPIFRRNSQTEQDT